MTEHAEQREQVTAVVAEVFGEAAVAGATIEAVRQVGRVTIRQGQRPPQTIWDAPRWMIGWIGDAPLGVSHGARSSPCMPPALLARLEARLDVCASPRPRVDVQVDEIAIVRLGSGSHCLIALGANTVVARFRWVPPRTYALRLGVALCGLAAAAAVGAFVGWGAAGALAVVAALATLVRSLGPGATLPLTQW